MIKTTVINHETKQLKRLALSMEDIAEAKGICQYILSKKLCNEESNPDSKTVGRWLQSAMIVAYWRPFSGNKDSEDTLERPGIDIDQKLSSKLREKHEKLKKLRNQVFAHSEAQRRELKFRVYEFSGPTALGTSNNLKIMQPESEYVLFLELFEKADELLTDKYMQIQEKLENGQKF